MKLEINTEPQGRRMYMHVNFLSGTISEDDDSKPCEARLDIGAGCGHSKMLFSIYNKATGEYFKEVADIAPLFQTWCEAKMAEMKEEVKP